MQVRIVNKEHDSFMLSYASINPNDDCQAGMIRFRQCQEEMRRKRYTLSAVFRQTVLETVVISRFGDGGGDAGEFGGFGGRFPVIIESTQPNVELTAAFRQPNLLDSRLLLGSLLGQFSLLDSHMSVRGGEKAILLTHPVTKLGWLYTLAITTTVAAATGAVLGLVLHHLEIGLAVGFGLVGIVGCLEAFVFYVVG